jgi:Flp pilus assembly protein TadG
MRKFRERTAVERGAVAVEFALIMPVLLLILFGTIEFGRVWSQYQVFQGAAREGARCAAVAASSSCNIQDRIDGASGAYTPAATASVQVGSGAILAASDSSAGCTNATKGQDVRVYWSQPLDIEIPFWDSVTVTPTIEGVFRCE